MAVCAGFLALGVLYILLSPRVYQASSALLVDINAPSPVDREDRNSGDVTRVLTTQADIVRTPAVAASAAQLSGLTTQPGYISAWQKSTGGSVPLPYFIGSQLLKTLTVQPKRDTNVLQISASSSDPKVAAAVANSFAQAAVNTQYRLRTEPAKAYAAWLETRLQNARLEVNSAQDRLSSFVRATGITNDGDLSSEGSQMAEVETQLAAAQAKAAAAQQDSFSGTQGVADAERSETVQRLRQQVATSSGKVAELEAVFGAQYPEVTRTRAELQTLRSQLNSEIAQARSTFTASRSAEAAAARAASRASEARLRAVANQQRSRMMSMGTNLARYSTLKNEFEAAKKSFNDINERLVRMRLQGAVPETEVKIIDVAAPPLLPSSPKTGFVLALCLLLGLVLGALAAIVLEALDPRVRSRRAIERLLGVRVVGNVALPAIPSGQLLIAGPTPLSYFKSLRGRNARQRAASSQMDVVLPALASAAAAQHGSSRIVIASVGFIEGAQAIAGNLAQRAAAHGYRTLAVDANLHQPMLHIFFNVDNERGLSKLLGSSDAPHRLLQPTSVQNITVLPAGPIVGDGLSLLTTENIFHRVAPIARRFDCVMADCTRLPPAVVATVARTADSILLLAQRNETSLRKMSEFLDLLREKETVEPSLVLVDA